MLKARYLAIADSCGDAMTYYILTEPDSPKVERQVLMRSVIRTRRKNIGEETEYVNDNPEMESFTLSLSESLALPQDGDSSEPVFGDLQLLVPGEKIGDGDDDQLQPEMEEQTEVQVGDPTP